MKVLLAVTTIFLLVTSCSTTRSVKFSGTNFDGSNVTVYRDAESGAMLKQVIDDDSKKIVVVYKNR